MRKLWVKIDPWHPELATTAIEGGACGLFLPAGGSARAKALGRITTIAPDGDLIPEQDVVFATITSQADEEAIIQQAREHLVILNCPDWSIIPLENLIARQADVVVPVTSLAEAQTAFGILEKGVQQILLNIPDVAELQRTLAALMVSSEHLALETLTITAVQPAGMGDRVCVDTCTRMQDGEGLLVGNSSQGLFLIHSESLLNPYVAPRPFRVNAGALHAYVRVPEGKTRYLCELAAGDEVLITNPAGQASRATVGRIKIERRPLLLITARTATKSFSLLAQNAETIRLVRPDGGAVSVATLQPDEEVLAFTETRGRHFGHAIDETIMEQ